MKLMKRAFTMLEVFGALAVLSAGAAATLTGYSTVVGIAEHQRKLAGGIRVAQSTMTRLLVASATSPLLTPTSSDDIFGSDTVDSLGRTTAGDPVADGYIVNWEVKRGVPLAGSMLVIVEAQWVEKNKIRSTKLQRYRQENL